MSRSLNNDLLLEIITPNILKIWLQDKKKKQGHISFILLNFVMASYILDEENIYYAVYIFLVLLDLCMCEMWEYQKIDHTQRGYAINVSNWLIKSDEIDSILKNGLNCTSAWSLNMWKYKYVRGQQSHYINLRNNFSFLISLDTFFIIFLFP